MQQEQEVTHKEQQARTQQPRAVQNGHERKPLWMIPVVAIALLIAALLLGLVSGFLYFGTKSPDQKVSVSSRVCGADMISKYEKIDTGDLAKDKQQLLAFIKTIKDTKHSENDPTCQTMLFFASFRVEDYMGMEKPLRLVKSMHDKGVYADSNLRTSYSISGMSALHEQVVSDAKSS